MAKLAEKASQLACKAKDSLETQQKVIVEQTDEEGTPSTADGTESCSLSRMALRTQDSVKITKMKMKRKEQKKKAEEKKAKETPPSKCI